VTSTAWGHEASGAHGSANRSPVRLQFTARIELRGSPATAVRARPVNHARSKPAGSGSAAPRNRHALPSHTSTHVWLPPAGWSPAAGHSAMPAMRAGTPTERHASASRIDRPVHEASPCSIDSEGLWQAFLRLVE
jgi:hypothetical protein